MPGWAPWRTNQPSGPLRLSPAPAAAPHGTDYDIPSTLFCCVCSESRAHLVSSSVITHRLHLYRNTEFCRPHQNNMIVKEGATRPQVCCRHHPMVSCSYQASSGGCKAAAMTAETHGMSLSPQRVAAPVLTSTSAMSVRVLPVPGGPCHKV